MQFSHIIQAVWEGWDGVGSIDQQNVKSVAKKPTHQQTLLSNTEQDLCYKKTTIRYKRRS